MKVVVFAGGVGSRLWPLSRRHQPKQFEKIVGKKSTLQLAVERVLPIFKPEDIYISSGKRYRDLIFKQVPTVPKKNFILEPEMRDVGAAVGLVTAILAKIAEDEPFIILWSDHLVKNEKIFRKIILVVNSILQEQSKKIVFIGQESRFASQNLGWIEYGEKVKTIDGFSLFAFNSFHYRPSLEKAEKFHTTGKHFWNPGYFGTTPKFLFSLFEKFSPDMYRQLKKIQEAWGTAEFETVLEKIYPTLEKISFDNLILEKIATEDGLVVGADLGWSDIGAWESLKEALVQKEDENVTRGKVLLSDSRDSLVFNYTDQLVVGIDLDGLHVVTTDDVILVCPKNSVPKIKKIVENLRGTSNEHLV